MKYVPTFEEFINEKYNVFESSVESLKKQLDDVEWKLDDVLARMEEIEYDIEEAEDEDNEDKADRLRDKLERLEDKELSLSEKRDKLKEKIKKAKANEKYNEPVNEIKYNKRGGYGRYKTFYDTPGGRDRSQNIDKHIPGIADATFDKVFMNILPSRGLNPQPAGSKYKYSDWINNTWKKDKELVKYILDVANDFGTSFGRYSFPPEVIITRMLLDSHPDIKAYRQAQNTYNKYFKAHES